MFLMMKFRLHYFKYTPDKAPGPDGYNAYFFQKKWDIVGPDTCKAIHSFFNSGRMLTEVNYTFVTLIPKSSNAPILSDFRPISCCKHNIQADIQNLGKWTSKSHW